MFRLNEAIAKKQTEENDKKVYEYKQELAALLWPDSTPGTQNVNLSNLTNGKTKAILPKWVPIICEKLGCTPNYLFGFNEENKDDE